MGQIDSSSTNKHSEQIDRFRELCPEALRLAYLASESQEGYLIMKKAIVEAHKQLLDAKEKQYGALGRSVKSLDSPSMALSEIVDDSFKDLLGAKGLKKKEKIIRGRRKNSWVEMQGHKKKNKKLCETEKVEENNKGNGTALVEVQETCRKNTEENSLLVNSMDNTNFMQLLHGMETGGSQPQTSTLSIDLSILLSQDTDNGFI